MRRHRMRTDTDASTLFVHICDRSYISRTYSLKQHSIHSYMNESSFRCNSGSRRISCDCEYAQRRDEYNQCKARFNKNTFLMSLSNHHCSMSRRLLYLRRPHRTDHHRFASIHRLSIVTIAEQSTMY